MNGNKNDIAKNHGKYDPLRARLAIARQFQVMMITTRRQIELTHRGPHQILTFNLQLEKLSYLPDVCPRHTHNRGFCVCTF